MQWDTMGTSAAESLAAESGKPVIWASDGTLGFGRPLAEGETAEEALADFDSPYIRDGYHGHERYEVFGG